MKLFNYTKPKMIVSEEGKQIRDINDVYEPEHIDPETGEVIPEHFPYYTTTIFVPDTFTEDDMNEQYIEEDIEE